MSGAMQFRWVAHIITKAGLLSCFVHVVLFAAQLDPNAVMHLNARLVSQAWKDRIGALPGQMEQRQRQELLEMIQRIRALRITKGGPTLQQRQTEPIPDGNTAIAEPNKPQDDVKPEKPASIDISGLDPNMVIDPFKMAELLSITGHRRQAIPFYQRALVLMAKDDPNTAAQRQWALLQLGRCLLEDQPVLARQMFSQLISEYPDSPWLRLAMSMQALAEWYIADKPLEVIKQINAITGGGIGQQR